MNFNLSNVEMLNWAILIFGLICGIPIFKNVGRIIAYYFKSKFLQEWRFVEMHKHGKDILVDLYSSMSLIKLLEENYDNSKGLNMFLIEEFFKLKNEKISQKDLILTDVDEFLSKYWLNNEDFSNLIQLLLKNKIKKHFFLKGLRKFKKILEVDNDLKSLELILKIEKQLI